MITKTFGPFGPGIIRTGIALLARHFQPNVHRHLRWGTQQKRQGSPQGQLRIATSAGAPSRNAKAAHRVSDPAAELRTHNCTRPQLLSTLAAK